MSDARTLRWTVQAVQDLARLRAFLQPHQPAAAQRAAARIKEAAAMLLEHPALGRPVEDLPEFRDLFIPFGKAGYVLRYRLEGQTVVVVRVWHGREEREQDSL